MTTETVHPVDEKLPTGRLAQTVSVAQAIEDSVAEFAAAYASGEPQQLMGEFMARKRSRLPSPSSQGQ